MIIFLSHWPIDRFCLSEHWLRLIGGRNLKADYYSDRVLIEVRPRNIIDYGFGTVVYTVADNTLHLIIMYHAIKLII